MPQLDANQIALALTCVLDASLCAVDPSGAALHRAHCILRDGLRLAEEMNAAHNNVAADIIREVVATLSESEPFMKARTYD